MKRINTIFTVLMAATLFSALPVLAEEGTRSAGQQMQKDECLLMAQNCRESVDSIQQRIAKLNREIGKGSSAYTRDELRLLNSKLNDSHELLRSLMEGGA